MARPDFIRIAPRVSFVSPVSLTKGFPLAALTRCTDSYGLMGGNAYEPAQAKKDPARGVPGLRFSGLVAERQQEAAFWVQVAIIRAPMLPGPQPP